MIYSNPIIIRLSYGSMEYNKHVCMLHTLVMIYSLNNFVNSKYIFCNDDIEINVYFASYLYLTFYERFTASN